LGERRDKDRGTHRAAGAGFSSLRYFLGLVFVARYFAFCVMGWETFSPDADTLLDLVYSTVNFSTKPYNVTPRGNTHGWVWPVLEHGVSQWSTLVLVAITKSPHFIWVLKSDRCCFGISTTAKKKKSSAEA
jgi:hypothetical protein